jgi:hypothetical protein
VELEVVHDTRYDYARRCRWRTTWRTCSRWHDAHQQLLAHDAGHRPRPRPPRQPGRLRQRQRHFSLAQPHDHLSVRATSRVRLQPRFAACSPGVAALGTLAARLRYVAAAPFDPAVEFALPSPYVPRLRELRAYAAPSFPPGRPVAEAPST